MIDNESYLMEPGAGAGAGPAEDHKEEKVTDDGGEYPMMEGMMTDEGFAAEGEVNLAPEGKLALPSAVVAIPTLSGIRSENFNSNAICERIHKVSSKWFQKKVNIVQCLIDELCVLNEPQRLEVVQLYSKKNKKNNLAKLIRANTKDCLRDVLLALTIPRCEYDAHWLNVALRKKSVNLLINILCAMSSEDVKKARLAYDALYPKTSLLKSVLDRTSGWFHKRTVQVFFSNLLEKGRPSDSDPIDKSLISKDAETLVKISKNTKLDKASFVEIFSLRSFEHLAAVAVEFQRICEGKDLISVIKESFKEQSETGYACNVTLFYATRRNELFADFLTKTIAKPGKHYDMLTRIVVSRSEVDLYNILQCYGHDKFREWTNKEFASSNRFYGKVVHHLCGFQNQPTEKKK
ncbi:hypothetical protein RFI_16418 [Reticulomyxa filosa]|uniref:Uncharacterized protein n=1 Tax=Reticulomyxa filosa TaxID=46433 RepID=X6N448_RETFI|nr:hypothetical protein RFI_16418 [Reticulomyxa filosa]|eukprot:ETO20801.1 hypothetical protein RFI_16418 [Reticulomyxa filosa]